jgi:hypothetical protein
MKALAKPAEAAPPMDYEGLVAAIAQAHDHAQRQAVQAVNVALPLRNGLIGYHFLVIKEEGWRVSLNRSPRLLPKNPPCLKS